MAGRPQSVDELFPRVWLRAEDLGGRPHVVTIARVDLEDIRQASGEKKTAAVLTFEGAKRRMIANKTQCSALASVCGSGRFSDWVGHDVVLEPATAPNGRPTIAIRAAGRASDG